MNLNDLANMLEKKAETIDEEASNIAKRAALVAVDYLAYNTPVDTSNAISNWIVSIGSPFLGTIQPHFAGFHGSTFAASAKQTVADAQTVIASKKPGQVIHITNNEPYVIDLNNGSSRQSPGLFVEGALLVARKEIES